MITVDYVRLMARYNAWQNASLYAAAAGLADSARRADRGAFFGSIHGTLCHILWADRMWMSRFAGTPKPTVSGKDSPGLIADWDELAAARTAFDATILGWARDLAPAWLEGDLVWYSGLMKRDISEPKAVAVAHFFNH